MKKLIALVSLGLLLTSCGKTGIVNVDIDYAKTTYGFVNNGGFTSGTLLLWDRKKSTITVLENVECTRRAKGDPSPIDIETSYDFGLNAGLKLTAAQQSIIESSVKSRTSLVANDVRRYQCSSIVTSLTKFINSDPSVLSDWFFADAAKNPDLLYLFVSDVTIGDSIELQVDNQAKVSAGFPVDIGTKTVQVEIDGKGLGKIKGDDVVLMFNVRVLRATYVKNDEGGQNASFDLVNGADLGKLRKSLRNGV